MQLEFLVLDAFLRQDALVKFFFRQKTYLWVLGDAVQGPGHGVASGVKASPEQHANLRQQPFIR